MKLLDQSPRYTLVNEATNETLACSVALDRGLLHIERIPYLPLILYQCYSLKFSCNKLVEKSVIQWTILIGILIGFKTTTYLC